MHSDLAHGGGTVQRANWRFPLVVGISTYLCSPGLAVAEISVSGYLSLSSDYVFRGVSQTMSGPALQAQIDLESDGGWYGYAWGSNVDFIDSFEPDDGVDVEVNFGMGYAYALSDNTSLSLEVVSYLYPGAKDGVNYDYNEWLSTFSIAEQHHFRVGYTDDVFGTGSTGVYYALRSGFALAEKLGIGVEVGHYQLGDDLDTDYNYAELSIEGEGESLGWWISYIATTGTDDELFYSSTTDDRLVLGLSLTF